MNNQPKLSIVIPTYNVENYITNTLSSLINQTILDFEIVMIDDGSTDNTIAIAEDILSRSNVFNYKIVKKENGGVSSARNRGLEESSGEYVFFLDGDDFVSSNLIEVIYNTIKNKKPHIVCWGYNSVNADGTVIKNYFDWYSSAFENFTGVEALKKIVIDKSLWIWTGSAIYNKNFLLNNNLRYTENCCNGEDQEFTFKALVKAEDIIFVNKILSFYLNREGSISNKYSIKRFDALSAMKRTNEFIYNNGNVELKGIADYLQDQNIIENYFYNLKSCFNNSEEKDIRNLLKEIDIVYPGLNNEMRRIIKKYKGTSKQIKLEIKMLLIAPFLYFTMVNLKKKVNK